MIPVRNTGTHDTAAAFPPKLRTNYMSSTLAELRMEDFFTPTRRFQDRHDYILAGYTEVQLAVSIEAFMNHPWDWSSRSA